MLGSVFIFHKINKKGQPNFFRKDIEKITKQEKRNQENKTIITITKEVNKR